MSEFLMGMMLALQAVTLAVVLMDRQQNIRPAAESEAPEEEARRSSQVAEGFENLMNYEVNLGRGLRAGGEP